MSVLQLLVSLENGICLYSAHLRLVKILYKTISMCNKMRAYVQREYALAYLDELRARLSGRASRSPI